MSETPAPLELTVTEDPITGTWTFTLHGHRIEVQRTHGFIKIDTIIHDAPLVQGLTDIQDLAGEPLDYIQHLLSTTRAPAPPTTTRTVQPQVTQQRGPTPTRTNEPSHEPPPLTERPAPGTTAPPSKPITTKRARRPRPQPTEPTTPRADTPLDGERVVLTTDQAATYLGLSPTTLETLRTRGGGPPFVKLGRRVVYRSEDLATWLAHRVRRSTSDPGLG
jgi:excisionase family DNA binding protein